MKDAKAFAMWYGAIALVVISLPLAMAAVNRVTGGAVGRGLATVIGGASNVVLGAPPVEATTAGAVEGPTGARLVVV